MKKVLIVDDEAYIHQLFIDFLTWHFDCEAQALTNVDDALESMEKEAPDLVFLDINMPGMNSLYLVDTMHADERLKNVPIFVVSAMSFDEVQDTFIEHGASKFFSKMSLVDFDERPRLIEALSKILPPKGGEA